MALAYILFHLNICNHLYGNRVDFVQMVSQPVFVELLQLLDAVSRMASLGFEKSFREAIVLMTRSYLSKLSSIGSAESKTMPPEATTERVEVCSVESYAYLFVTPNLIA